MADEAAARVRLARDRLIAGGAADPERVVVQILALALHLGDLRPIAGFDEFSAARRELSHGPGHGDRSLLAGDADPGLATLWPGLVDLLAPAVPRDADALGAAREALLGDTRKRSGSFYTRPPLARAVARRTLAPWLAGPTEVPAICDPAMGCGALLLAALALLGERFTASAAIQGLHGVDADPLAVDLSRFLLWRAAGAPAEDLGLARRLVGGDSLVGAWIAELPPVPEDSLRAALDRRVDGVTVRPLHWELAFPAVFAAGGFAAVLANPPWDAIKPTTREFLRALHLESGDPRTDPALADAWRIYCQRHAALSRWFNKSGQYSHQGRADRNAYKLFSERCLTILRPGGALGLLVPAGIYSDHQTAGLRRLLLSTLPVDPPLRVSERAVRVPRGRPPDQGRVRRGDERRVDDHAAHALQASGRATRRRSRRSRPT
jgi:hypothetical protein